MDPTNFYLVSATVIAVLALTNVAARTIRFERLSEEAEQERDIIITWARNLVIVATSTLTGWAEFVCLRRLETGHVPPGGSPVVWAALVVLAIPLVTQALDPHPGVLLVNLGYRMTYHGLHGVYPERPEPSPRPDNDREP